VVTSKRSRTRRKTATSSCFPTFQNSYLQSFSVCSCFPLSSSPLSKFIRDIGSSAQRKETRFDSARGPVQIRIRLNQVARNRRKEPSRALAEYEGHFHVECSLEASLPPLQAKKSAPNSQEELLELLKMFAAGNDGVVCCTGRFLVPRKLLPRLGVVDAMLDVSAKVENAEMVVTGVSFEIQNRPPYGRLRWKLKPETKDATELEVEIAIWGEFKTIGASLEKMSEVLWNGVQELVIETTSRGGA